MGAQQALKRRRVRRDVHRRCERRVGRRNLSRGAVGRGKRAAGGRSARRSLRSDRLEDTRRERRIGRRTRRWARWHSVCGTTGEHGVDGRPECGPKRRREEIAGQRCRPSFSIPPSEMGGWGVLTGDVRREATPSQESDTVVGKRVAIKVCRKPSDQ